MERLTLKAAVTITGLSPFAGWHAKKQHIVMRPLSPSEIDSTGFRNGMGWYWQTRDNTLVPIDMSMVPEEGGMRAEGAPIMKLHPFFHYLYFQRGREKLKCVEHILALKALGLDGVVIKAIGNSTWVPYDGRAISYWNAIEDNLKFQGHLAPMAMQVTETCEWDDPKIRKIGKRIVSLDSTQNNGELAVSVTVDYPRFGGAVTFERQVPIGNLQAMQDVLDSRGMMQSWHESLLPLLRRLRWQQESSVLKLSEFTPDNQHQNLLESARHGALDALGVLAVLAEPGTYLPGRVTRNLGNHKIDYGLVQKLVPTARQLHSRLFEPPPDARGRSLVGRAVAAFYPGS